MDKNAIIDAVQERYGSIARGEKSGCGCGTADTAIAIGYSAEEVALGEGANLGLGCGNPLAMSELKPGMTVLDLGSGAGFDAFLAWRTVGTTGRVIGVDMTDDMLARARANAEKLGATNVEFRKGFIEKLPVENASVDYVISNCVINLSPDKPAVFKEIARVLKPGGRVAVSDIVLLNELPDKLAKDVAAYTGCISGASQMGDYIRYALEAGLSELQVKEVQWGAKLAKALMPQEVTCCGGATEAAEAIASIKLHGRKA
jgi:arsenite methyltransferase